VRSSEEIVELYHQRRIAAGPVHEQMRRVRDLANGDVIVPLNELDRNAKTNVANLLVQGLDQTSMRVASTMPSPYFPPVKEGSENAKKYARMRKKAMLGFWDENRMQMKMRRRARHLLAYSQSPVFIKPDFRTLTPRWEIRNPLDTFAAPMEEGDVVPENCIFTSRVTASWLLKNYGEIVADRLRFGRVDSDSRYTLLEYVCDDSLQLLVLGAEDSYELNPAERVGLEVMLLEAIPNRTGMPLAVVPQRITLDKPRGQFDGVLGMYYTRARLQALTEIAIERGIFPEEYLIARPGENPEILQMADGKSGILGVVKGGDIQQLQLNPGYKTDTALDRLERQERLEGAIPAEFGGESARTFVQVAVVKPYCQPPLITVCKSRKKSSPTHYSMKTRLLLLWSWRIGVTKPKPSSCLGAPPQDKKRMSATKSGKQTPTMSPIPLLARMSTRSSSDLGNASVSA
jgi:hypothetical protein